MIYKTARDRAIKRNIKKAYYANHNFFEVDGEMIATAKPKPVDRLPELKKRLRKLKENYNIFVKKGDTESALQFEAEIKKVVEQIAKEKAA